MTGRDAASERQVQAADPSASTWLSANAGSGKTRVLIDRVARLLLNAVDPQRILCLTYTKAAASEMQNRLFRRLGYWAMLDEATLRAELVALGVNGAITPDRLRHARRLFARAIEAPGGLKIQTIHSFCAGLLRRFPLEAGVSPQFTEMDDRAALLLREDIVDRLADGPDAAVLAEVAQLLTAETFVGLTGNLARYRSAFDPPLSAEAVWRLFDLPPGYAETDLLAEVFTGGEAALISALRPFLRAGSPTDARAAEKLPDSSQFQADLPLQERLEDIFLYGEDAKAPYGPKIGSFPTKATRAALGPLLPPLDSLMQRVADARPHRLALLAAQKTLALHRFASLFLPAYAAEKAVRGWLDFDDLILRAKALLTDPQVAQWVLFRLDGGIDHLLIDEAQDTGPDQWAVVSLLTQEFTAGRGARAGAAEGARSIFVVGDKKQSIYSFQGADLTAFDRMRSRFADRLGDVGVTLHGLQLEYSFRSSAAILRVVDETLRGRAGVGETVSHLAFQGDHPGRVDLWPVEPKPEEPQDPFWYDPVDIRAPDDAVTVLARRIATEIRRIIDSGTQIPAAAGPRRVTAGDVLILVQRRSAMFHALIRACKALDLPIAGADRLKLGAELAVKDLAALLCFLALPEDDLSLAAALRSPLCGWAEADLYDLAQPRPSDTFLWQALRGLPGRHAETLAMLEDLRDQADYLRPYDLLERVLTRHRGRRRLLARLGAEAEDGIDALLAQALAYEQTEVPSLTGFLSWIETDDVEVKRQLGAADGRIRVMTVHGAKGLESPIVILPDTGVRRLQMRDEVLPVAGGAMAWKTAADAAPPLLAAARRALVQQQEEENMRLLYVAMTRAESWLIVAAAGDVGKPGEGKSWYDLVAQGMAQAGAAAAAGPEGQVIQRHSHAEWPIDRPAAPSAAGPTAALALPDWVLTPAPSAPHSPAALSPSALGGAKALPGEPGGVIPAEAAAILRGTWLHRLLEHLPDTSPEHRTERATALLATGPDPAPPDLVPGLLAEATAVLAAPGLAHLLAPGTLAEVEVSASLPELGGLRILGTIDRLVVSPDHVLIVDYKSNQVIPPDAAEVPEGILRQLGAYAAAIAQIYPDRRVETAVLWTRGPHLMPLPRDLVMAALRRTPLPTRPPHLDAGDSRPYLPR